VLQPNRKSNARLDHPVPEIRTLLLDVGGVLRTPGWDRRARAAAAQRFNLDAHDLEARHASCADSFERGHMSLADYLGLVVFYEHRGFSREDFETYMSAHSDPIDENVEFFTRLKTRRGLKIVAISNEGRELSAYHERRAPLGELVDAFLVSGNVGLRKPDPDLFRLALDVSNSPASGAVFVDRNVVNVEMARLTGIRGVLHVDLPTTKRALGEAGLQ
jgi:putative hydrolase of the HAD superfamily